jgi:SRSO17 transposase
MERRRWARVYLEGLLLDGERKSIEPIASRIEGADVQALRQFVGQSPWAVDEVQRRLALKVADLLGDAEVWILDDTSFPKAGKHSVGVARQYCGALGKVANCQVAVSLHWSSPEASCPLGWRLYLPREWIEDRERAERVKLPADMPYKSKTELGLELIDQTLDWGLAPLPLVADSYYGNDFCFREQLRSRSLLYAVQVEPTTVAWDTDPNLPVPPSNKIGRPRKHPPLEELPTPKDLLALAQGLPERQWCDVSWREGSRGPQQSRFGMLKVWAAHGWKAQKHPQRVPEWLLVEWPKNAEKPVKYWLAQLGPRAPSLRQYVKIARARWRIELDYRELKDELGLDHFEGRHWLGWNHHVTLVSVAYAFLRAEQARRKKNFWCDLTSDTGEPPGSTD